VKLGEYTTPQGVLKCYKDDDVAMISDYTIKSKIVNWGSYSCKKDDTVSS
jgi:hypothetical protein